MSSWGICSSHVTSCAKNQISAAALSTPVRTSSWCISEWVFLQLKDGPEILQEKKKRQPYFTHEFIFSEEEKIVKPQKKNSRLWTLEPFPAAFPYLPQTETQAWERRTAEMRSLLFLLLCGSYGKTRPGQMISLCVSQPKNLYSCKTKPLPTIIQALQGTCQGM